jgi:predicted RNA methylase
MSSLAPFVPSPPEVVRAMLQLSELKPGETLYDLGCGDGRIVVMAVEEFSAKAVGVELDSGRFNNCVKKLQEEHIEDKASIIHEDVLKVDLSKADVVTLYLLTSANEKLKPNLERDLRKGARVVSHDFEMPGWHAERIQEIKESEMYNFSHTLYMYRR